jgi:hypothetical protein
MMRVEDQGQTWSAKLAAVLAEAKVADQMHGCRKEEERK